MFYRLHVPVTLFVVFTKLTFPTWFLFCFIFVLLRDRTMESSSKNQNFILRIHFFTHGTAGMKTLLNFECFDNPPHHERRWQQQWHYCHFDIELTLSRMNLWREPSSKIATSLLHSVQKSHISIISLSMEV